MGDTLEKGSVSGVGSVLTMLKVLGFSLFVYHVWVHPVAISGVVVLSGGADCRVDRMAV